MPLKDSERFFMSKLKRGCCFASLFYLVAIVGGSRSVLARCQDDVCIKMILPFDQPNLEIPPEDLDYVITLPETPGQPTTIYIYLMRKNAAGKFEIINGTTEKLRISSRRLKWKPEDLPQKKLGQSFVLAATLDPKDKNPRARTLPFKIKWGA